MDINLPLIFRGCLMLSLKYSLKKWFNSILGAAKGIFPRCIFVYKNKYIIQFALQYK